MTLTNEQIDIEITKLKNTPLTKSAIGEHCHVTLSGEQIDKYITALEMAKANTSDIKQGMAFIKNNDPVKVRVFECWSAYPNSYGEKVGLFTCPNQRNDLIAVREHMNTLTRAPEHDIPTPPKESE